jgi:hypothetical protein
MATGVNIVPHVIGPILIAHWRVSTPGQVYDGAGTAESAGEFDKFVEIADCDAVAHTSGTASDANCWNAAFFDQRHEVPPHEAASATDTDHDALSSATTDLSAGSSDS